MFSGNSFPRKCIHSRIKTRVFLVNQNGLVNEMWFDLPDEHPRACCKKNATDTFAYSSKTIKRTNMYCTNSESWHFEFFKTTLDFWNISKLDLKNSWRSQNCYLRKILFCPKNFDDFLRFNFLQHLYGKGSIFW